MYDIQKELTEEKKSITVIKKELALIHHVKCQIKPSWVESWVQGMRMANDKSAVIFQT